MIDLGVMNNFADNKKPAIFENLARCIGEIDRALDTVAKPKLFRQAHRGVAYRDHSPGPAYLIDNVTTVVRLHLFLHRGHDVRCTKVHLLARGCAAGNKVRAHKMNRRVFRRAVTRATGCSVFQTPRP